MINVEKTLLQKLEKWSEHIERKQISKSRSLSRTNLTTPGELQREIIDFYTTFVVLVYVVLPVIDKLVMRRKPTRKYKSRKQTYELCVLEKNKMTKALVAWENGAIATKCWDYANKHDRLRLDGFTYNISKIKLSSQCPSLNRQLRWSNKLLVPDRYLKMAQ
ncbi:hypothetical protein H5410_051322 [Solanum commersonii]|uniref:Uncharacterized protein n=1 Tax=Solanum commersonii TaxID=4109 RepID=A0A9J5WZ85_SOLCO|nr:hypothetical protein H5410_051322 [Solanum commersonii]